MADIDQRTARFVFARTAAMYGLQRSPHAGQADQWGGGDFDWVGALEDLQAAIDSGNQQAVQDIIDSAPSGSEQGYEDVSYTVITPDVPVTQQAPAATPPATGGTPMGGYVQNSQGGWYQNSQGGWEWNPNATTLYPTTVQVTPPGTRYDATTGSFLPIAAPPPSSPPAPPVASGASSGGSPVQTVTSPVVYTPAPATTTAVPGDTTQSGIDRNVLIGAGIVGIGALLLLRR